MDGKSRLRDLLKKTGPIVVAGAHNALSAKLVEKAGFDAIWVSGFEISTTYAVPDANIVTMAENLAITKSICDQVSIPVIVDCDNGYGNAINVMRTVEEFEKVGAAAICIEDNIFPKRCSFYSGVRRELETIEEFAGKIRAAKGAQRSKQFVVIARTEALIADWGMEEALRRARAYAGAGADMLLVHSKSKTSKEVTDFAKLFNISRPLIAIPTTYKSASVKELYEAGFKMVIFANQGVRASINAMREVFSTLRKELRSDSVDDRIVSLEEIYDLVGLSSLALNEAKYLPVVGNKAIIVAAGYEPELMPFIEDRPKCMLEIRGKTILERQIETLNQLNIRDIIVVRGYQKEKINLPNVRYYDNEEYSSTHNLYSLFKCSKELDDRILFLYADILFDRSILEKLLNWPSDIGLVVDHSWREHRGADVPRHRRVELVKTKSRLGQGSRFITLDDDNVITRIGGDIDRNEADGEFIGMAIFSEKGIKTLKKAYEQALREYHDRKFHESPSIRQAYFTDMIQELINRGVEVRSVDIYKGWIEVDSFEDYRRAWVRVER